QTQAATTTHEGHVHAALGHLEMHCDRLTVVKDEGKATVFVGTGSVTLTGFPGFTGPIRANRWTFNADANTFSLGGDVRLPRWEGLLRARSCTLTRRGGLGEVRTLLQDFADVALPARLDLLSQIEKVYADDELPDEVRLLLALRLLRPHLRWHAPYI